MGNKCCKRDSVDIDDRPLLRAVKDGDLTKIRRILSSGVYKDVPSALMEAAASPNRQILSCLIEKTGLECRESNGDTALIKAVKAKKRDSVKGLLDSGADPNISNARTGESPLILACKWGLTEIVTELLKCHVNVDYVNADHMTAYLIACQEGHTDIMRLLKENGTDLRAVDEQGNMAENLAHSDIETYPCEHTSNAEIGLNPEVSSAGFDRLPVNLESSFDSMVCDGLEKGKCARNGFTENFLEDVGAQDNSTDNAMMPTTPHLENKVKLADNFSTEWTVNDSTVVNKYSSGCSVGNNNFCCNGFDTMVGRACGDLEFTENIAEEIAPMTNYVTDSQHDALSVPCDNTSDSVTITMKDANEPIHLSTPELTSQTISNLNNALANKQLDQKSISKSLTSLVNNKDPNSNESNNLKENDTNYYHSKSKTFPRRNVPEWVQNEQIPVPKENGERNNEFINKNKDKINEGPIIVIAYVANIQTAHIVSVESNEIQF